MALCNADRRSFYRYLLVRIPGHAYSLKKITLLLELKLKKREKKNVKVKNKRSSETEGKKTNASQEIKETEPGGKQGIMKFHKFRMGSPALSK